MLRMCDGCKDVLDTDQDGSQSSVSMKWGDNIGLRSPHFVLNGAHPSKHKLHARLITLAHLCMLSVAVCDNNL